jgi:hypothetical protein
LNDITDYQWLVSDEAQKWLDEAAELADPTHRMLQRLRKSLTAERARLVAQQTQLRAKAVEKFGVSAAQMYFTDLSLQQATDCWIAAYKAKRFIREVPIVDYCCGIGGDLVALASRMSTTAWDRSAEMVVLAAANARALGLSKSARVCLGNVEDHPPAPDQQWHLDPDRRSDGRRSTHIEWHSPNEATIRTWLSSAPNAAVKLAPASMLDTDWQSHAELEWISRDRQCRQLVAWFGDLTPSTGLRRATAIHGDEAYSFAGIDNTLAEICTNVGEFIYDTDPAIRAAKLTGALATSLDCKTLSPGESYLTADRWVVHPLVNGFQVTEKMPLRLNDLVKHLKTCDIGTLEIKTRGVATQPEQVRSKLKLTGTRTATLLLTKLGKREIAILAERRDSSHLTDHSLDR